MKLAIMQPYFFPYLGYFSLIDAADEFVIYDDVSFIKRGFVNRNTFLGANGPFRYTLPVQGASQNMQIDELALNDFDKNADAFLNKLKHSYSKAPYYEATMSMLNELFSKTEVKLADFLVETILATSNYIGINTSIRRSSELKLAPEYSGQQRIIKMCQTLEADEYVNAVGGISLYDPDDFRRSGVALQFVKFSGGIYSQFDNEFVPNLSIIDTLMFNSPSKVLSLVKKYELVDG